MISRNRRSENKCVASLLPFVLWHCHKGINKNWMNNRAGTVLQEVKLSKWGLIKGVTWTVGTFGAGQIIRLVGSIALTRLLSPQLIGIMTIVNSVRSGIDLLSDVGIAQSIVQNKNAENPAFYNTAWSLKVIRGVCLCIICGAVGGVFGWFYRSPIVGVVLPVMAFVFLFDGINSVSPFLMQRRLQLVGLNLFGLTFEFIGAAVLVVLAYLFRSIWSLVFGVLIGAALKTLVTHFLLRDVRVRFHIAKQFVWEIIHFGKWIFLSSIVFFLAGNFDRLFLGKVVPFAVLGVYSVARNIADMMIGLVSRICSYIVFPYIASSLERPKGDMYRKLAPIRLRLLFVAALGLSGFAAVADVPIKIIYDERYHAAAAMMPIFALGVWFATLCSINESMLLGLGEPKYLTIGNASKFGWTCLALPFAYSSYGLLGVIVVTATSDIFRYVPIFFGQIRLRFSFGLQDVLATLFMFAGYLFFVWLRWFLGFGVAFRSPGLFVPAV